MINPAVENMSTKEMERTIFDILTDNGMTEEEANKTMDGMSSVDMRRYLSDAFDNMDESEDDD